MMKFGTKIFVIMLNLFLGLLAEENISNETNQNLVTRGEVQSCRGCSLNRLPDVKNFIYGDLPKYTGVEFHPIPGAVPHLVLFDKSDKELDRIDLSSLTREECNELARKFFKLKEEEAVASEEVKEEL